LSDLLNQIQQLLPAIAAQTSWDLVADEDQFEGYPFALVLNAAEKEGVTTRFENRVGPFSGICTFRTSPGHL
jgi:hypothetical protein